jgi:hypothetical protein
MTAALRATTLVITVVLLAAGLVTWAALPLTGVSGLAKPLLVIAAVTAFLAVTRTALVAFGRSPHPAPDSFAAYDWPGSQAWLWLRGLPGVLPWDQILILAILILEALHRARPWHTALLAVVLTIYLLLVHQAEATAKPSALRPQLPLLAAAVVLIVISATAASIPPPAGAAADWLIALSAIAAVLIAALALPL